MATQTSCSSCSTKFAVKEELIGKAYQCPKCGKPFQLPNQSNDPLATGEWQEPSPEVTGSFDTSSPGKAESFSNLDSVAQSTQESPKAVSIATGIGRYRVDKILGEGGFGVVYLAHDDELKRRVAIKVPQAKRIRSPKDAEAYLVEAQVLAKLDHPHIVPVYDVGRSEDGLPYVVSKFIEGCSLAERMKQSRLAIRESVTLVATMAEALQYAHQHRLVHRDVKPGNILLDTSDRPFLVDFGLALKEEDFGKGGGILGTPAFMSPEQANGEGHLVDGRSDIFSLGVVLYELLAGQRPFAGKTIELILLQITTLEPRPPRQIDPAIPKELERITLKALAKKATDRFATALDFADDLNHWLKPKATVEKGPATLKIIPKGLRSFDAHDADFFLELLPGPRDRNGLPDTLRFWKNRIEETVAEQTFRVGVIYGPSGCGKSSFVKAGLLPRLANTVRVVYVEATPDDTEARLLKGIQKACAELSGDLPLREAVAHLRRQERPRHKLVLVLDQFEQWLHGKHNQENAELIQALRQCDGERVQAIVMVRDDFWMALTRFMREMEIPLVEKQNSAAVDLFDPRHAKKVLTAFGQAYGTLQDDDAPSKEHEAFLEQAVAGLAQEGKVISVRLALFAEMVKGKPWTPATLKEIGGTEGVGVTFLEGTFSASTAPPEHRYHQKAARAVLKALLPEQGTDIKGQMRSQTDLLEASGYVGRPKDFEDLLAILNSEVRLVTPTDPEGNEDSPTHCVSKGEPDPSLARRASEANVYYQLTHDYLVPSLRDWLTRKQKETRRGRAELLLADRAAVWNARTENRQLPSLLQWMQLRWWTQKKNWTPPQRKMMGKATRYHAVRTSIAAVLLVAASFAGLVIRNQVEQQRKATHAAGLVQSLLNADTAQARAIVDQMADYRQWTDPHMREENGKAAADSREKLHISLALLSVDATHVDYLYGRLLDAEPQEVPVIRDFLLPHKGGLLPKLWAVVETPAKGKESQRLRAAAVLAKYDPASDKWAKAGTFVVNDLVLENPIFLGQWSEAYRPVRKELLDPLSDYFKDRSPEKAAERTLATNLLADYATDNPQVLADLLMEADEKQYARIFPLAAARRVDCLPLLTKEVDKKVKAAAFEDKLIFERKGTIANNDPKVKPSRGAAMPSNNFEVSLQGGKRYRLTMDSTELDPFLVLQDKTGKELAFDDDSGGGLNSLLLYTPFSDDTYTVFAAALQNTRGTNNSGAFVLKIVETPAGEEDDGKEKLAMRQANAAVVLLRMGQPEKVWPLLKHSPDPRLRSYLIHRFEPLGAEATAIMQRLDEEPDITIQRALILSLGEYGEKDLPMEVRQALLPKLQSIYRSDPDPGLHGAAEWLLRHWKQEPWLKQVNEAWAKDREERDKRIEHIQGLVKKEQEKTPPQWYVNGQGQTMVVIPGPVEFLMGSPATEKDRDPGELRHKKRLGRTFALAAASVTKEQFLRFLPKFSHNHMHRYPEQTCPIGGVTWYEAAGYCNWLSKQEGIAEDQWCYKTDAVGKVTELRKNYLSLAGYRLPTEAEMEYATRAGAFTARYYGETEELLRKYAWYEKNSEEKTWPVGRLKPNDLGLFDMQGNVNTWCQESLKGYTAEEDKEDSLSVISTNSRVLRGGSFSNQAPVVRSSTRGSNVPAYRFAVNGFRPSRTLPLGSFTALQPTP